MNNKRREGASIFFMQQTSRNRSLFISPASTRNSHSHTEGGKEVGSREWPLGGRRKQRGAVQMGTSEVENSFTAPGRVKERDWLILPMMWESLVQGSRGKE